MHAAGTSVVENDALNEPFLQNWNIDYGPLRVDFSVNSQKKARVRFLPESIVGIFWAARFGKFNLATTLRTGNLAFVNKDIYIVQNGDTYQGFAFGRAFVFVDNITSKVNKTISHEIVHLFQYNEYEILNTWFKPTVDNKIKSKTIKTIFTRYICRYSIFLRCL